MQNHMILIFGATGDLAKKKLIPALYKLYKKGYLSQTMPIVCIGRKKLTKNSYIDFLAPDKNMPDYNDKLISGFYQLLNYVRFDIEESDINTLCSAIARIDKLNSCKGNKIIYLALAPKLFLPFSRKLEGSSLLKGKGWKRVVYEKPFGHDLASAREINSCITSLFDEKQIFRIDHYLAKELVQNILTMRFSNAAFFELWNNRFIDHVQITVSEEGGVDKRGTYYDTAGAIRDMLQNHLLQVMGLIAMEAPKTMDADAIRLEKARIFKALQKPAQKDVVIGQYTAGKEHKGYRNEDGVKKDSKTETFVAVKLGVNTQRWKGVPFYLRTGKMLSESYAEVNLVMKQTSCRFFKDTPRNVISIRIQPDEGLKLRINAKEPGSPKITPVSLDFCHQCRFAPNTADAYEHLLKNIMQGDQTLFTSWDELEASWNFTDALRKTASRNRLLAYAAGNSGPKDAETLVKKDKREWI